MSDLNKSLKVESFGRILVTNHLFLIRIKKHLSLNDFLNPKQRINGDHFSGKGVRDSRYIKKRNNWYSKYSEWLNVLLFLEIWEIRDIVNGEVKYIHHYFNLLIMGKTIVGDLVVIELHKITRFVTWKRNTIQPRSWLSASLEGPGLENKSMV